MISDITYCNNCDYADYKKEYQRFLQENGPYKFHISITLTRDYKETQLVKRINFLLKVLSRNIFNNRKNEILLTGFCCVESSSAASRCNKHCHILLNDHQMLEYKRPFIDIFYECLERVKVQINGRFIDKCEFDKKCVEVISVYDEVPLIDYVTDEFWKDKNGNFIKPIYKNGLLI